MMLSAGLVMRVHFVRASAYGLGAFRVITANVQQASHAIEIKGAPLGEFIGASDTGEEFRVAFAANVRDGAASAAAKTIEFPSLLQTPVAEEPHGEEKLSAGLASYETVSSEQPQTEPPVSAKNLVATSQGVSVKTSTNIVATFNNSLAYLATTSAEDEADPSTFATESSSSAGGRSQTVSGEDVLPSSPPKHGVETASGDEAQPVAASGLVERSPSTTTANGIAAANSPSAELAATGMASARQPAPGAGVNASQYRKGVAAGVDKGAASSAVRQIPQTTFHAPASGLAATPELLASLTTVPYVQVSSVAAEQSNVSKRVSAQFQSPAPLYVASDKAVARIAVGENHMEAVPCSASSDEGSAQPEIATAAESRVAVERTQAVQANLFRHKDQETGGNGTIEGQTTLGTRQNVPTVGLSSDSTTVSERIPVSSAVSGASSSNRVNATTDVHGIDLQGTVESRSISAAIGDGTGASKPEPSSKPALAVATGSIAKQQFTKSDAHTGVDSLAKTTAATVIELAAVLPKTESIAGLVQSADARPAHAPLESSVPVSVAREDIRPTELSRTAIAVSPSVTATGKANNAKRPGDERASTPVVPQSPGGVVDAAVVPIIAADGSRESAQGVAATASGIVAVPLAHPTALAIAAPVHIGDLAVSVNANSGSATSENAAREVGLEAVLAAQSSTAAPSAELHRTLLATPTALEVGVQSGTQGWLKIRAEVGGQGEVKASLDALSMSGRDVLHSQLPALNAFLHSEQMPVTASIAERNMVADTGAGGTPTESGGGFAASNGSMQGDGGQRQAGQHLNPAANETLKSYDAPGGVSESAAALSGLQAGRSAESGRWLNVRV